MKVKELKTKVDHATKMVLIVRSIELSNMFTPKTPTCYASCQCLVIGNTLCGYLEGGLVGFGVS